MNNTIVTIKDIAKEAGVSTKTVERALSGVTLGLRKDAGERAQKIKALAESMGYKPSRIARTLQSGRSHLLGFLVNNITDQYFAAATEIAMDEAEKAGYALQLKLMRFSPEREVECVNEMRSLGADGIILGGAPSDCNREYFQWLKYIGYPMLTLGTGNGYGFPALAVDHTEAMLNAVGHLHSRGHRRIRLCMTRQPESFRNALSLAFTDACRQYCIQAEISCCQAMHELAAIPVMREDAVIVYGKYSLRIFLDGQAKFPRYKPDLIGFFNEWTWASSPQKQLCGVIINPAEQEVRSAVHQIIASLESNLEARKEQHVSSFYPAVDFRNIKAIDLSSRYLLINEENS